MPGNEEAITENRWEENLQQIPLMDGSWPRKEKGA
jgi:hypothetical protein